MCLAIPLQITEVVNDHTAVVRSGDVGLQVDVSLIHDPAPGDFVIVHAGFAIEKLDNDEAQQTLDLFDEIKSLDNPS